MGDTSDIVSAGNVVSRGPAKGHCGLKIVSAGSTDASRIDWNLFFQSNDWCGCVRWDGDIASVSVLW